MKTILIAEDDQFLANAYRVKLSKLEFKTLVAFNGDEALALLKNEKPDLILLDLIMPQKDGFTVLAEIKQQPELQAIPVIVATNLGQREDIDKAMKLGAADYIIKSNTPLSELVNKINALLQGKSTQTS